MLNFSPSTEPKQKPRHRGAVFALLAWCALSAIGVLSVKKMSTRDFRSRAAHELAEKIGGINKTDYSAIRLITAIETLCDSSRELRATLMSGGQGAAALASLDAIKSKLNADIVYVMGKNGDVAASTRYGGNGAESNMGKNFAQTVYFKAALAGHSIVYPEAGSGGGAFYFAAPIHEQVNGAAGSQIIGVGALKFDPKFINGYLSAAFGSPVSFVSPAGAVLASNVPAWLNKSWRGQPGEGYGSIDCRFDQPTVQYNGKRHDVIKMPAPHLTDTAGQWEIVALEPFPWHVQILWGAYVALFLGAMVFLPYQHMSGVKAKKAKMRAERQTLRAKERAELLYRVIPSAVFSVDLKGKITSWNDHAAELTGYAEEEAIGSPCSILAMPSCFTTCDRRARDICKSAKGKITEIKRKDGARVSISMSSDSFYDSDGQMLGGIGCFEDITEKLKAEAELIETRKQALKAAKTKSEFLANMSHEIRTPMNAILGFAQVLEGDPTITRQQAKYIDAMEKSGKHLLNIINDILDMSKIESGKAGLNLAPFCFAGFLDDLESLFQVRAAKKGLGLEFDRSGSLPKNLIGDEGKLRQILINLIGNAFKYTKAGRVTVIIRTVAMGDNADWGGDSTAYLAFEVQDTGVGIPAEDLPHLFDAFQQFDSGIQTQGTGLGLAISKGFVELMGGELSVQSELGKGSCFSFCVPMKLSGQEAKKREQCRITGIAGSAGPVRILVADDSEVNRFLFQSIFASLGIESRSANNGLEAIREFESWRPHLIIMDMRMPEMDGYEATRRIKDSGASVPIIAVTASAFEDDRSKIMASGVDGYIRKPFVREELLELVGSHLRLEYTYELASRQDSQGE